MPLETKPERLGGTGNEHLATVFMLRGCDEPRKPDLVGRLSKAIADGLSDFRLDATLISKRALK